MKLFCLLKQKGPSLESPFVRLTRLTHFISGTLGRNSHLNVDLWSVPVALLLLGTSDIRHHSRSLSLSGPLLEPLGSDESRRDNRRERRQGSAKGETGGDGIERTIYRAVYSRSRRSLGRLVERTPVYN